MADAHERFQAALAAHLAEVLPEEESAWMEAHAAECDACRDLLERVRARLSEASGESGHAPAALLSAWLRERDAFTPLERTLLERHLAGCEECRADLEEMAALARLPLPSAAAVRRPRRWLGYGGAGLVVAAAILVVFLIRDREPAAPPGRGTPREPSEQGGTLAPPAHEPLLVFRDRVRGTPGDTIVVDTLRAPAPRLRVRLPQIFLGTSAPARLLVLRSGERFVDRLVTARELEREFVVSTDRGDWPAGEYELRVIPDAGRDTTTTRRYRFALVSVGDHPR